jgi:hypothetical protein
MIVAFDFVFPMDGLDMLGTSMLQRAAIQAFADRWQRQFGVTLADRS